MSKNKQNWYFIESRSGRVIGLIRARSYKDASRYCLDNWNYLVSAYHPSFIFKAYYYLTRGIFHIRVIKGKLT